MNKHLIQKIKSKLKELNIGADEYILVAGTPLAVRGLKPSNDIDVQVSDEVFEALKKKFPQNIKHMHDSEYVFLGDFEFTTGDLEGFNYTTNMRNVEVIDGLNCQSLDDILRFKKILNREKDKKDIKLIEDYRSK